MDKLEQALNLLKEYEQWEADLISDNQMWWPNVAKDRISGKTYDKMLELQSKRNELLKPVDGPTNSQDCICGVPFEIHATCCGWENVGPYIFPWENWMRTDVSVEEKKRRYKYRNYPSAARLFFPPTYNPQVAVVATQPDPNLKTFSGVIPTANQVAVAVRNAEQLYDAQYGVSRPCHIEPRYDFADLMEEAVAFTLKTFTEATPMSSMAKLTEEIKEVMTVMHSITTPDRMQLAEEFADCLFCLLDCAARSGITPHTLINAFAEKLEVNRQRQWIMNPDRTYSHQ